MADRGDSSWLTGRAKELGFDLCGVVRAAKFPELAQTDPWLAKGYAGEMKYLSDSRRSDPQTLMPTVRSIIVCALNYNTDHPKATDARHSGDPENPRGWISRYAWGDDYHQVLQKKLHALRETLRERYPAPFEARVYADTGPIHERALAKYAGLGWIGKNTLLLNQGLGSWIFLGAILTSLDLEPTLGPAETPPPDLCGTCRRCLDACPTQAFPEPYVLDARRCISYLTIELRGRIPEELREPMGSHVFGCDICQDVCPWNRRSPCTSETNFQPRTISTTARVSANSDPAQQESLLLPRLVWLASMGEEEFRAVFRGSAIKRTKWRGLVRNACIALGNSHFSKADPARARIAALLRRLADSPEAIISESARWALSRIQQDGEGRFAKAT
jgi:epoxyqueuosine reductase